MKGRSRWPAGVLGAAPVKPTGLSWPASAAVVVALAALLALVSSCAYYNVFWMANREYDKATVGTYFADFWDPYAQKVPTGDNLKNIDSCIKRCGKILLLYPKSGWVDDTLVLMGNCFVIKGEYANAQRKYEELLRLYPSSPFADEARYMRAYTHVLEGDPDQALDLLGDPGEEFKAKQWSERALFLSARILREQGNCAGAITHLEAYRERFPKGLKVSTVTLALGDCLIRLGKPNEAVTLLESMAASPDLAGLEASADLGRAYRELGQPDKALDILTRLYDRAVEDTARARAQIEIAVTLDGLGRYEEALEALSLADSLGKTAIGGEAMYRTGLVEEKGLGDFAKAVAAYEVASKGTSEFAKLAAKRGAALRSVEKYSKALSDSTLQALPDRAANRFMLAETYLLDLGLAGRAAEQFRVLSDSLPSNPFTARAKLALGSLLDADRDSAAITYYRSVIDSFPGTVYANVARFRLGLPLADIVAAPPDTAQATPAESLSSGQPEVAPGAAADTAQAAPMPQPAPALVDSLAPRDSTSSRRPWQRSPTDGPGQPADSTGIRSTPWPPLQSLPPMDSLHAPADTASLQDSTGAAR
jgi:tetratricopeptide (TPR) repeat protein